MVKDKSLADPQNMKEIKRIASQYPDLTLILAHAARSFAPWTVIESVGELCDYENVWYDFAANCESPSMIQILKKVGVSRCMWGSDYNICKLHGKAISIADSFYWIGEEDLRRFSGATEFHAWHVGTENLMALRQACIMLELSENDVEKLFYKNAERLFDKK
jgi:glutamate-1-semialdehyde 2,1-aminomutase